MHIHKKIHESQNNIAEWRKADGDSIIEASIKCISSVLTEQLIGCLEMRGTKWDEKFGEIVETFILLIVKNILWVWTDTDVKSYHTML